MKEDQTLLIESRLEHLRFMMESGKMPVFRHRSDMFLFALEAHNIARGLSSRYYRLQEDLDIRFFVRFRFDYWLQEIRKWTEQLNGDEYRVDSENIFAEGRAKRLTIIVNRLFGYHLDRLPADSALGSLPLPDEEIHEPFRKIAGMKSTDLVASFRTALQDVHDYLFRLAMLPVEWSAEDRRKALRIYLEESRQKAQVQSECTDYKYFCCMPDGQSVRSQFCFLRQRLYELAHGGELAQLKVARSEQQELLRKLSILFGREETSPSGDQVPSGVLPMADDELFAKFLYFVRLDGETSFPALDEDKVANYLIRKDVFLTVSQENNLQALFALMEAMRPYFTSVLEKRNSGSRQSRKISQRAAVVMAEVKRCNGRLSPLLASGHTAAGLDAFFERLFSPSLTESFGEAQGDLLSLLEKDREGIKLEPYIHLLREVHNHQSVFVKKTGLGKEIYRCLEGETIVQDANAETVNSYFSKTGYRSESGWQRAVKLVETVLKDLDTV